ncbi:MAG: hypothetical protein J6386_18690 [Candidatus Synoicihabitans palmerolidicus]|nr:hypothetical protein [Candidatus Synoicihabitans palmerolidicus]
MKLIHKAVGDEIALQSWLRPALTTVGPNKDYGQFREPLDAVDRVLRASHLESMAMDFARVGFESVDAGQLRRRLEFARKALRVHVLRMLLGNMPFRQLSRTIEGIKGVSKSVLERASQCFTAEPVRWMGQVFIEMVAEADRAAELGLAEPQSMETCLVDSTCWPTNIHFPVDWVLLRDVSRTLLKAVILIRRAGMRARMPAEPEVFARQMNRLCIEMTHTRRRANAKRARKQVLRKMKRLLRTIGEHAQRHRNRLDQAYASTHTSARQAARIVKRIVERIDERIDAMLAQMPATINQAHERIIGARPVPNAEKILRVYEPDVQTVVRGKASGAVEFGNTLMISENVTGLITDWQLYQGMTPAEWRQFDLSTPIKAASTDRGFSTQRLCERLAEADIYDATCPRDPQQLQRRMQEPQFVALQHRRASTEARIAIIKQRQSKRLSARGFTNRYLEVAWSILGHNLWLIARLLADQPPQAQAA